MNKEDILVTLKEINLLITEDYDYMIKEVYDYINSLQQENEKLKEEIIALNMKYGDGILLQERIDKAIEYINKLIFVLDKEKKYLEDKYNGKVYMYKVNYVKDLLDILKGE